MKADSRKPIRRRSDRTFAGLPLFDIAYGPDPDRDEPHGKARGIIAIGDEARGWLALGDSARGYIALGRNARGVIALGGKAVRIVALGGASIGFISLGGWAAGRDRDRWPGCRWSCRRRPVSRRVGACAERKSENNSV